MKLQDYKTFKQRVIYVYIRYTTKAHTRNTLNVSYIHTKTLSRIHIQNLYTAEQWLGHSLLLSKSRNLLTLTQTTGRAKRANPRLTASDN